MGRTRRKAPLGTVESIAEDLRSVRTARGLDNSGPEDLAGSLAHPSALLKWPAPEERFSETRSLLRETVEHYIRRHYESSDLALGVSARSLQALVIEGRNPSELHRERDLIAAPLYTTANVVRKHEDVAIARIARTAHERMSTEWRLEEDAATEYFTGGLYELDALEVNMIWPAQEGDFRTTFERRLIRAKSNGLNKWRGSHHTDFNKLPDIHMLYGGDARFLQTTNDTYFLEVEFKALNANDTHEFSFIRVVRADHAFGAEHGWFITPVVPIKDYVLRVKFPGRRPELIWSDEAIPRWAVAMGPENGTPLALDEYGELVYKPRSRPRPGLSYGVHWTFL